MDLAGNMIGPGLYARLAHDFPLLRGIKNTFDDVAMAQQFKYAMPDRQVLLLTPHRTHGIRAFAVMSENPSHAGLLVPHQR